MEDENMSLDELKPFLPPWLWELKKRLKEERERKSELLVKP